MAPKVETMRDFNDGGKPYCSLAYGPLLFAYGLPEQDDNTPAPGARTDWRLDSSRVLADAQVVRTPMPAKWDWPLAAPLRLKAKATRRLGTSTAATWRIHTAPVRAEPRLPPGPSA